MTFLWDSFVSKLRSAGTSVDAIQYCSENVLIELIQDLGFNTLQMAQIQTEWKQRVKVLQRCSSLGSSSPVSVPPKHPLPYHSTEFTEVSQHVLSHHVGGPLAGWSVVAIDGIPPRAGAERHLSLSRSGDAIIVTTFADAELGHLIAGTTAVHNLLPIRPRWAASSLTPQIKLVVGVVSTGQSLTTRTADVFLPAAPPAEGLAYGQASTSGQGGLTVPLGTITGSQLKASGYDTIIVEDNNGHAIEYRVSSAEQVDVRYVVTVVQLGTTSSGCAGVGTVTRRFCERHPDHAAEFWNPIESTLTCALCHLVGSAQKHPCMPLMEAASMEDSQVSLWVGRAKAHLEAVDQSHDTVLQSLDVLEADYRKNTAALRATVDNIKRELDIRRDELMLSMEKQFDARRTDLRSSEQSLAATSKALTELISTANRISTPLETMIFRRDVSAAVAGTAVAPVTIRGVLHIRPVSWDAHMRFESETSEVKLPLCTSRDASPQSQIGSSIEVSGGLIHWLGTFGGFRDFINPHSSGAIVITASQPFVVGEPSAVVSRSPQEIRLKPELRSWIQLDLGTSKKLVCKKYALRHGHEQDHAALRDWALEASNDAKEWTVLRRHKRDTTLKGPYGVGIFPIEMLGEGCKEPYRFFRIRILGANNAGPTHFHIEICDIELYGTLYNV